MKGSEKAAIGAVLTIANAIMSIGVGMVTHNTGWGLIAFGGAFLLSNIIGRIISHPGP